MWTRTKKHSDLNIQSTHLSLSQSLDCQRPFYDRRHQFPRFCFWQCLKDWISVGQNWYLGTLIDWGLAAGRSKKFIPIWPRSSLPKEHNFMQKSPKFCFHRKMGHGWILSLGKAILHVFFLSLHSSFFSGRINHDILLLWSHVLTTSTWNNPRWSPITAASKTQQGWWFLPLPSWLLQV